MPRNADREVEALRGGEARPSDAYVAAITRDPDWLSPFRSACDRFDISTPERLSMFFAQVAHESSGLTRLVESLHYSASGLLATFPRYFQPAEAVALAYNDRAIGERVYGGRMGNALEGHGDGYNFRGRGALQITGRAMYRKCSRAIGVDVESIPMLLEQPTWAALSAAWVWADEKGCNQLADAGDFRAVTKAINGGYNGMSDREGWLDKMQAVA